MSDKVTTFPKMSYVENDEIISDESKIISDESKIHLVISLKMLSTYLVSKQTNIQMIAMV